MKNGNKMTKNIMCSMAISFLIGSLAPSKVLAMNKEMTEYNIVKTYKKSLKKNITEVKEMVKELAPHKKSANQLVTAKDREKHLHIKYEKVLREKNRKIFEYMKLTENLKRKGSDLGISGRIDHELKKRSLTSDIEDHTDELANLKSLLLSKNSEIKFLKNLMNSRTKALKKKVSHLNGKIKKLDADFKYITAKMVKELKSHRTKDIETINELQGKLIHSSLALAAVQTQFPSTTGKVIDINKDETELQLELKTLNNQLASLDSKYKSMEQKYKNEVKANKELMALNEKSEIEYKNQIALLKSKVTESEDQVIALESKLSNAPSGRFPASVPFNDDTAVLKAELSKQIAIKIKEAKIGFLTEFNEDNISITLDEKFFFNSDSSSINDLGKEKLKTLISIYSQQLFQHEKIRERIKAVSFIGHSSPRYNSEAVDPLNAPEEAFQYNMTLSTQRAQSVANLIFAKDFGDFEYKDTLRAKTVVSGRGFSTPIPAIKRELASVGESKCGAYDCRKSRRVEIIFELRDMENAKK